MSGLQRVPVFGNTVIAAGIDFTSVRCDEDSSGILRDPEMADPVEARKLMFRFGTRTLRAFYDAICMALMAEPAILISSVHHLAARAVKEKYRVPLVGVRTQPSWTGNMIGAHANREDWLLKPSLGMGWPKCLQLGCMTAAIAPALRKLCSEIGISIPRQRLQTWKHPPDLSINLFPEWFCDWPARRSADVVNDGFPLEDLSGQFAMPGDLRAFIDSSEKLVLLTLEIGSAWSQDFFETGLRACALIGARALFATSRPDLLPNPLPSWARAVEYHPFSEILPRVCAVVHDGGIGTLSQCLAAGVPQLITPMLRDQQGNAARVRWLGAGETLIPSQFSVESVASSLIRLTSGTPVRAACESMKTLCQQEVAGSAALDALERVALGWQNGAIGRSSAPVLN